MSDNRPRRRSLWAGGGTKVLSLSSSLLETDIAVLFCPLALALVLGEERMLVQGSVDNFNQFVSIFFQIKLTGLTLKHSKDESEDVCTMLQDFQTS